MMEPLGFSKHTIDLVNLIVASLLKTNLYK